MNRYINEKQLIKYKHIYIYKDREKRRYLLCEMGCLHPRLHGKCSMRKTNVCSCQQRQRQQILKKKEMPMSSPDW